MYWCNECERDITIGEREYSEDVYMRPLCLDCQHDNSANKGTHQQEKLCRALRAAGYQAYMELFDGFKHIDIAIPALKLNIEVDGLQHIHDRRQRTADRKREGYSFSKGYDTIRVLNSKIDNDFKVTATRIINILNERAINL
ncbi:DUF559 domain-containing protein [Chloroflexota bacterium]